MPQRPRMRPRPAGISWSRSSLAREDLRILYGGSVAPENAPALLGLSGMDGFLIGGASLAPAAFAAIAGVGAP